MGLSPRAGISGADRHRPLAEINVTPLVDVMLVLLIIFMITAPMLAAGMKVNLPHAKASQQLDAKDAIVIGVGKHGRIMLGSEEIARERLAEAVRSRLGGDESRIVQLRGDREAAYGEIVAVLDDLARHGIVKIAIITDKVRPAPAQPKTPPPDTAAPDTAAP